MREKSDERGRDGRPVVYIETLLNPATGEQADNPRDSQDLPYLSPVLPTVAGDVKVGDPARVITFFLSHSCGVRELPARRTRE